MTVMIPKPKLTKGEQTAQKILDAAENLFAEKGYTDTSLREVAAVVGIKEPGLYRHFKNKEALYQSVLERGLRPIADTMDKLLSSPEEDRLAINDLPEVMFDLLSNSPRVALLLQQALTSSHQSIAEGMVDQWLEQLLERGRLILEQAQPGHKLSQFEIALQLINLFNLCTGYFSAARLLERLSGENPLEHQQLQYQKQFLKQLSAFTRQLTK